MTGDHDALLRAVCENPREDTPRLVYADWLDDNADAYPTPALARSRAEFIRTSVAMALRDEWDPERMRWEELSARQAEAFGAARLVGPLNFHGVCVDWCRGPLTHRGFPRAVSVSDIGAFRNRAAELFATHPIEHLSFQSHLPQLHRLVAESWFPRVIGLEWSGGRYTPLTLLPLLAAPVTGLTQLAAHAHAVTPDGLRAVFTSPLFPNLTDLSLISNGPQVVRAALDSLRGLPASCRLRSLTIRGDGFNRDTQFLACHLPGSLRVLDVAGSRMNADAVREFAGAKATFGLRMLTLSANHLGNAGAAAVFTSPHLAGLKVLDLSYCQVGDEALHALLEDSPLADELNLLNLTGSPASGDMKQAVKDRMGDRVRV